MGKFSLISKGLGFSPDTLCNFLKKHPHSLYQTDPHVCLTHLIPTQDSALHFLPATHRKVCAHWDETVTQSTFTEKVKH